MAHAAFTTFGSLGSPSNAKARKDKSRFVEYQTRIAEIESAVRLLKVARPFEVDLHRLRIHLRIVEEDINRLGASASELMTQSIRGLGRADQASMSGNGMVRPCSGLLGI